MFCNRFLTPSFTCCLVLCFYECISSGGGEGGGGMLCVEYDELSVAWSGFCGVSCQFLLRMFFDFWQMTFCVCECVFGACGLWLRSAILAWLLICLITDINFKFEKPQTVKEIYRELERERERGRVRYVVRATLEKLLNYKLKMLFVSKTYFLMLSLTQSWDNATRLSRSQRGICCSCD